MHSRFARRVPFPAPGFPLRTACLPLRTPAFPLRAACLPPRAARAPLSAPAVPLFLPANAAFCANGAGRSDNDAPPGGWRCRCRGQACAVSASPEPLFSPTLRIRAATEPRRAADVPLWAALLPLFAWAMPLLVGHGCGSRQVRRGCLMVERQRSRASRLPSLPQEQAQARRTTASRLPSRLQEPRPAKSQGQATAQDQRQRQQGRCDCALPIRGAAVKPAGRVRPPVPAPAAH